MKFRELFANYRWQFIFTLSLILLESVAELLFPLFIGLAIEGAMKGSYLGVYQLGGLGLISLLLGSGRRFYDSRFYAKVYRKYGGKILERIKDELTSIKTARLGMIREWVEFMENALPELIKSTLGIIGVASIILALNSQVFLACLITTGIVFLLYWLSRQHTTSFNSGYNNELERQVEVIHKNEQAALDLHLKDSMKWNIKLSDLETFNFSMSWLILISFLLVSIVISTQTGTVEYGILLSLIMYVFQYMESVIVLPLFYQNWLRLAEIKQRLAEI